MEITVESIRDQIPYYLTQEMKAGIVEELKKFPSGVQYFLTRRYLTEMLQGDGWTRLHLRNFANGDKIFVNGVILSNTCDVTPENVRDLPVNIVFAPLIALDAYIRRLEMAGVPKPNIDDKVASIRQQRITNLFYVPAGGGLDADHIVLLDDIHTMPAKVYEEEKGKGKIFTLSQSGFYLFILKLSIHFCRFHENLARAKVPEFPKTLPYVTGRSKRRHINLRWSVTEILVLDENGEQRTQYGPGGSFGVYFWNDNEWQLEGIYDSRAAARRAAARIRRELCGTRC